jgi:hypothetical protein
LKNTIDLIKRTTLINDDVEFIKVGLGEIRTYWLDPAQRRYFPDGYIISV